jgi:hypothetical protein
MSADPQDEIHGIAAFERREFNVLDEIIKRIPHVSMNQQLSVLVNLLPYVLPRMKPIEVAEVEQSRAKLTVKNAEQISKLYWKAHEEMMTKNSSKVTPMIKKKPIF